MDMMTLLRVVMGKKSGHSTMMTMEILTGTTTTLELVSTRNHIDELASRIASSVVPPRFCLYISFGLHERQNSVTA